MIFEYKPTLITDLVKLRPPVNQDFSSLYHVASDPLIWQQHPFRERYQEKNSKLFFEQALDSNGTLVIKDKHTSKVIGSTRFHGYDESQSEVEIGWTFLSRKYWGGRYNKNIKQVMLAHAFKYVNNVIFLIDTDNIRSRRATEKIGAVIEGYRKNGSGQTNLSYRISSSISK